MKRESLSNILRTGGPNQIISRRQVLATLALSSLATSANAFSPTKRELSPISVLSLENGICCLEFDSNLRTRIKQKQKNQMRNISDFSASETIILKSLGELSKFRFTETKTNKIISPLGLIKQTIIKGVDETGIEKSVIIGIVEGHENCFTLKTIYKNNSGKSQIISKIIQNNRIINSNSKGFWTYSGATHQDRRDWLQPIKSDFNQSNFMGMNASDYGGGSPIIDVWCSDYGVAIGHLETSPKLVSFPVIATKSGVSIAMNFEKEIDFPVNGLVETIETFVILHKGDYFSPLTKYRQFMSKKGLEPAKCNEACYEPIWCAWGYDRDFTTEEVINTLPKVKELGLKWVVLDDGWQTSEGDWKLDKNKFPKGDESMREFVRNIKSQGLRPRLWFSPLCADPGTDILHDHTDMLLLNQWGEPQLVSWWNAFYLCPSYRPTVEYMKSLVSKFIGDWGFEGLKIDGQHLNGVSPCYNKSHNHRHPEDSFEHLQDFWREIYEAVIEINPDAVFEVCPCGTSYSYFNMPYFNQAPAADPLSSWQVRLKGKTLKALMGPHASYSGDHVELSDNGNDFASSVGVGAIVSTKFTWPNEGRGKDANFKLDNKREALWKKWIDIYNKYQLPKGEYLGELYDIGFDKPEAHVIRKDGALFYSFYAPKWKSKIEFRGLGSGNYSVFDYFNGVKLGEVSAKNRFLNVAFDKFLLVKAKPI